MGTRIRTPTRWASLCRHRLLLLLFPTTTINSTPARSTAINLNTLTQAITTARKCPLLLRHLRTTITRTIIITSITITIITMGSTILLRSTSSTSSHTTTATRQARAARSSSVPRFPPLAHSRTIVSLSVCHSTPRLASTQPRIHRTAPHPAAVPTSRNPGFFLSLSG